MSDARRRRGETSRRAGRRAEVVAGLWLLAKGYRILGFRLRTRQGEIDVLARRGGVLAVVEVKTRPSIEAALEAVSPEQRLRLRRAGAQLAAQRKALQGVRVRLDLLALAPGRWPRHIADAWRQDEDGA